MSLLLRLVLPVPEVTARVARAAFPDGNPYLRLRDELGTIFHDTDFTDLYPLRGQPALAPWRLALVTVLQFCEELRRVWVQQFAIDAGQVRWRTDGDGVPPARLFLSSPHDVEARYGKKGTTTWVGYKVHLTETCEDDAPPLIVHVATTPAPAAVGDVTPAVHDELRGADLLPCKHIVDTASVDAKLRVDSRREYGVELIGATRPDYRWQSKAGEGFAASDFTINGDQQEATPLPEGRTSTSWSPTVDLRHNEVIKIKSSAKDCGPCPTRARCTKAKRRSITVRPRDQYETLQMARSQETSAEYRAESNRRAGIEGTISQGVRACGLRRSRYVGEAKAHLQHVATATAMNMVRITDWLVDRPHEVMRTSAFTKLMVADAA